MSNSLRARSYTSRSGGTGTACGTRPPGSGTAIGVAVGGDGAVGVAVAAGAGALVAGTEVSPGDGTRVGEIVDVAARAAVGATATPVGSAVLSGPSGDGPREHAAENARTPVITTNRAVWRRGRLVVMPGMRANGTRRRAGRLHALYLFIA